MGKPKRLRSNPKLPAREIKLPNSPSKFCQWSDLSMQEVMKAVHEGKMSINREIAIKKGVTIKKHVSDWWFRRFNSRFPDSTAVSQY